LVWRVISRFFDFSALEKAAFLNGRIKIMESCAIKEFCKENVKQRDREILPKITFWNKLWLKLNNF